MLLAFEDKTRFGRWGQLAGGTMAVLGGFFVLAAWMRLRGKWTEAKAESVFARAVTIAGYIVLGPIGIALGTWSLVSTVGWLGTIPSWAAVIIVLLLVQIMKRD